MALSRSEQMSRIKARNTKPELVLRRLLWRTGLRYRLHLRTPFGRADLVFQGPRVAVFVDGCFWHGCPEHYVRPRSSSEFWARKLRENVERDIRQTAGLEGAGWRVCRLWEHEVFKSADEASENVIRAVRSPHWKPSISWRALAVEAVRREGPRERWHLCNLRNPSTKKVVERVRTTHKW